MEQIIIISLLIIIILILSDRKFSIKFGEKKEESKPQKSLPSVMGNIKSTESPVLPNDTAGRQNESAVMEEHNFDSETREEKIHAVAQTANPDEITDSDMDWEQEEEEWKYRNSNAESGFATGVSFQELSTAGQLLQQEVLEPDLEQQAVQIIQKIQGTELFDLLENSLGDASKRIAGLLSQSTTSNSTDDLEGFDIGAFI